MARVNLNIERLKNTDGATDNISYEDGNLSFKGEVVNKDRVITVTGSILCRLEDNCHRCDEPVKYEVACDFRELFSNLEELINEDPEDDVQPVHAFGGNEIDLFPYIDQQVFLNKPMKVLCSEQCRGLCPECGCNLNKTSCNCNHESIDPRMAVLADLLKNQ